MFKVLAAIHITVMTMLAFNDVGTLSCATGKPVTMALPITVFALFMITLGLGFGVGQEAYEYKLSLEEKR